MLLALELYFKLLSLLRGVPIGVFTIGVLGLLPLGGILGLVIGAISSLPIGLKLLVENNIVSLYYLILI